MSGQEELLEGIEVPAHKDNGEAGEPAAEEVKELFLVVHGIGQQLATTHESFNSVYVRPELSRPQASQGLTCLRRAESLFQDSNTLRMEAQKQAEGEAIKKMMDGHQVQFLPIQWRGSLKVRLGLSLALFVLSRVPNHSSSFLTQFKHEEATAEDETHSLSNR